jgi:hypothetical protein
MTDELRVYGRVPPSGTRIGDVYAAETVPLTLGVGGRRIGTASVGADGTLGMLVTDREVAGVLKPRLRGGDVGV